VGGLPEAEMAGASLKGAQGVEWRQQIGHGRLRMMRLAAGCMNFACFVAGEGGAYPRRTYAQALRETTVVPPETPSIETSYSWIRLVVSIILSWAAWVCGLWSWRCRPCKPISTRLAPTQRCPIRLHTAAVQGQAVVVDLLLRRGADRTLKDSRYKSTPSDWLSHARGPRRALTREIAACWTATRELDRW
jgi:hypothetical protein